MEILTGTPLIEPESRIEKGKDVKFSIDDLKNASEPEGWDGAYSTPRLLLYVAFDLMTDHDRRCS